jgi:hypothetical protein
MREFKDKTGQAWPIDLTIGCVLRVKQADSRFNLLEPDGLADKLASDELLFWELLWHVVAPQASERKISAEQFGELLAADCLFHARRLFFEEWSDFFRQLRRPDKATAVEKITQHMAKAMELVTAKISGPEMTELDQAIEARMTRTLNESFGELRASVDSIPARSPGGN